MDTYLKEPGPAPSEDQDRAWVVVNPQHQEGHKLQLEDILKFGRVKLRVAQIGSKYAQPYPGTMQRHLIDADEEEKKEQKSPFLLSSFAHELSAQNLHTAGAMQSGRDGF